MDRITFSKRLVTAGNLAVRYARGFVIQSLPDSVAFRVYPNQSYHENPLVGDEVVFRNESLENGKFLGPWTASEVVAYLWRDEKVPEWIDAAVEAEDGRRSLIGLSCCGRFTALEELLYHRRNGKAPFAIKSPILPPFWVSVRASGRFDLYRRLHHVNRPWWRFW